MALRAQFDDATTHYTDELNNFKMIAKDATENQTIIRLQNQNNSLQKQMRVNITQLSKAQEEQKQAKETILILESLLEKDEVGKEQVENKEVCTILPFPGYPNYLKFSCELYWCQSAKKRNGRRMSNVDRRRIRGSLSTKRS